MGSWNPPGNAASHKLQILLVGPRRTGKSSSGNTLLGGGQVFNTRGGGASTVAGGVNAGCQLTVVDAQGWGSSEEFVPREEKIELLSALSLCGSEGPHVVLLVIPLLDFTESERRAVERRMEVFTSAVWRHTMVLFTFGDLLKIRGHSIQEHIQSGGPALRWLMEKCRYRYHVLDNKAAVTGGQDRQEGFWRKKNDKAVGRMRKGGESDGKRETEQVQVRELLSKVKDMLEENGGWHFSLHMYQRLEEEWSRREQQLRARLQAETDVGRSARCKQNTVETKVEVEPEQELRLETGERERSPRKESENREACVERKINRGEGKGVEIMRLSSVDSDSGVESEEERRVMK